MATPFKIFRDNQKVLMVVFGALLMVAFIILPPVLQYGFDSQQAIDDEGAVVVTVGDEELRDEQVQQLRRQYGLVAQVMYAAMGRASALRAVPEPPVPSIPGFRYEQPSRMNPQGGLRVERVSPLEAIEYYAWGKKADEMGLVVDDAAVNEFLTQTAGGKLNGYDYDALLSELLQPQERSIITYDYFFEQVRDVLKAQKMQALMMSPGARVVTPTAAWVAYRNLNRTISADYFPIAAADYMDKVGEPTDAQVKELFDKYKDRPRNPMANQIGFRPLDKVALAYIEGDFQKFLENAKSQVTDEQVAQYYEENKESFTKPTLPSAQPEAPAGDAEGDPMETTEPSTETPAEETMPPAEEKPSEEKPAEEPMTEPMSDEPMEEAKPADTEKPADAEKPAETEAAPEQPKAEEPKTEEGEAEEAKSEEPAKEEPKKEDSSRNTVSNGVQLVSYLQEEGGEEPSEPEQPKEEAAPMQEAAPMEEAQPMAEVVVKEEMVAEEQPMTETPATEAPMEDAPVEYRSLAEVQDEIRTTLANPIAQAAMDEALAEIRAELQEEYSTYLYDQESEENKKSPYDSDALQTMATKLGLSFGALPLMDIYDAYDSELGESARVTEFLTQPQFQQVNRSLVIEAFQSSAALYQPRLFPGPTSESVVRQTAEKQFVYWKTEEKEGYDPTLEDVRGEVVKTWKELEAQKLAKAAAEKIAKSVTDSESLAKAATEYLKTVTVAENFTYFNQLGGPQNMSLGEIPGIPPTEMSQDTMEALFSTAVGKTTVAPNSNEDVYYVALVTGETETMQELRENFAKQVEGTLPNSVMTYALQENQMVNNAIRLDFFDPELVQWKVDPSELDNGA